VAIRSFRRKALRELFTSDRTRRIGPEYRARLILLLDALDGSTGPQDLAGAHGFHALPGDLAGFYALWVTGNWRLIFRFDEAGHAVDVDFVDYH
jgi:proteic killer suppression protein